MGLNKKSRPQYPETDVIATLICWLDQGHKAALATVISTWGSSPCPPGSHLAIRDDQAIIGSVSAGCVEAAVIHEAMQAIEGASPLVLEYGVSGEKAWEVGLACGGELKVLVRRIDDGAALYREAKMRVDEGFPSGLVTRISDASSALIGDGIKSGLMEVSDELVRMALKAAHENKNFVLKIDKESYFIEAVTSPNRLIIIGAVHIAQALAPMAIVAGFQVVVIDPRKSFATSERFPGVEIKADWPEKTIADLAINGRTAVVLLTHDPKIDDPVLQYALKSPAFYVGALGSRQTTRKRNLRLKGMGLELEELGRLHGPIGLDIGSKSPAEIAVSILAEIIQEMRH